MEASSPSKRPTWRQNGPQDRQLRAKMALRITNLEPRWPTRPQLGAKMASKSVSALQKTFIFSVFYEGFVIGHFFAKVEPKIQQKSPSCCPKRAKLPILGAKLSTAWHRVAQLGCKMRHTRPPNEAPDASQLASWAMLAPNQPWTLIFKDL